ncbi:MAG: PEP-CTERM sorting domain-containing protein [Sedimentisphaerales bacterium]|nr:PEP-CTERM sorting domain-containing protein [Sedimentisphaerales bacterium]
MRKGLKWLAVSVLVLMISPFASAGLISQTDLGLYNTGVDDSGIPLADNAIDPHWTLSGTGAAEGQGPDAIVTREAGGFPIGPWLLDAADPASAWITPAADTNGPGATDGTAIYEFSTGFTTSIGGTLTITGTQSADNGVVGVALDGMAGTFTQVGFNTFADFSVTAEITGTDHVLSFQVVNGAGEANPDGPIGLRVHINTVDFTPIPEPMTLSLLALGGVIILRKHW